MNGACMYCKQPEASHNATKACPLVVTDRGFTETIGWALTHFRICAHVVKVRAKSVRRGEHLKCNACGEQFSLAGRS